MASIMYLTGIRYEQVGQGQEQEFFDCVKGLRTHEKGKRHCQAA